MTNIFLDLVRPKELALCAVACRVRAVLAGWISAAAQAARMMSFWVFAE
jgi:hypothetical protein